MVPILVVASDGDMRETLCDVLEAEGYQVTATADSQAALAHLGTSDPPLVVVLEEDVHMRGLTAIQLIETSLQAGAPTSRHEFILLTDRPEAVPAALTGRVLVLVEPFNLDELLETVARAAARLSRQ